MRDSISLTVLVIIAGASVFLLWLSGWWFDRQVEDDPDHFPVWPTLCAIPPGLLFLAVLWEISQRLEGFN